MRATGWVLGTALSAACAVLLVDTPTAEACGCLSPPAVTEGDFAVNQRAEQIIFEVEPGWVTAHVLIKYAGAPEQFAWIVPVPEIPELSISPASAFALIDRATAPRISIAREDICPRSEWSCRFHDQVSCGGAGGSDDGIGFADAGFSADAGGSGMPPVTVVDQQVVGDYQTVTFRASEAGAATQWLRDNGFIVNQTTSIYMEPYVQANMVFVAAKLIPGAGVDAIKPLRMRYRAAYPMVPLVLTAVAAEPHLTVTSFIYSNQPFRPMGHPVVTIDPTQLANDRTGRSNYPMVVARAVDEAGGDGFVIEYRGSAQPPKPPQDMCCGNGFDLCGIGGDGQCQCPGDDTETQDCEGVGDVNDGIALVAALEGKYTALTRITTRVSPEEMQFDPTFEPDFGASLTGPLELRGRNANLDACEGSVIDKPRHARLSALQACSTTYCGAGECVTTAQAAACECNEGFVATQFLDLDGLPSVTCIPRVPPVDLRADGLELPNACANVTCGAAGTCIDRNGVAVCECSAGHAAIATSAGAPTCAPIEHASESPGAQDFSDALDALEVCAPPPPSCGERGWLVRTGSTRPGVDCGGTEPSAELTRVPPKPTCHGAWGCGGCQETPSTAPIGAIAAAWLVLVFLVKRRRAVRG